MNPSEVLRKITAALDHAGIAYMLTGSLASAMYGALRSTMDIDIVIAAGRDEVKRLVQLLPEREYYIEVDSALTAHEHESMFNVIDLANNWTVDLIFRNYLERWIAELNVHREWEQAKSAARLAER